VGAVGGCGSHTFLHWVQSVSFFFHFFSFLDRNRSWALVCLCTTYQRRTYLFFTHRHTSDYEKIIAAAADFTSGRVWPVNFASETGPKFVWEKVN
jgi:hypothetical protein